MKSRLARLWGRRPHILPLEYHLHLSHDLPEGDHVLTAVNWEAQKKATVCHLKPKRERKAP